MKKYSNRINDEKDERVTLEIEISNLTPSQADAVKNFLFALDLAGSLGSSREFACFVDGDGSFRPKVTIDGEDKKNHTFSKNVDFDKDKLKFGFE